jgi:hypothetical protein
MKNYAICLFLLCAVGLTTAYGQVKFGVKGGLTFADAVIKGGGIELDTDLRTTFHVGAVAEFGVSEAIAVNTGLLLAGRGYNFTFDFLGSSEETKTSLMYLQIPVNIVYNADLFYFSAGPYLGFGLAGSSESDGESVDAEFGNSVDDDISPTDFGVNVELGVNLNNLRLGVGYGLGLSNNFPGDFKEDDSDDSTFRNNAINVSATYFFGG